MYFVVSSTVIYQLWTISLVAGENVYLLANFAEHILSDGHDDNDDDNDDGDDDDYDYDY